MERNPYQVDLNNHFFSEYLEGGEQIKFVAHPHFFMFIKHSLKTFVFLVALPIVFLFYFPEAWIGALIWLFVGVCGMFYHLIDWFFDAWIITTTGVIDVQMDGIFKKSSKRVEYHTIEGVAYTIPSFFKSVMNFGDITIDKVGAKITLTLENASNPKRIESIILENQDKYVTNKSLKDHETLKGLLADMLTMYNKDKNL